MQASPSRLQRCDVTAEADGPKDSRMVSPPPKLIIVGRKGGLVGLRWVRALRARVSGLAQPKNEAFCGMNSPKLLYHHFSESEVGDPDNGRSPVIFMMKIRSRSKTRCSFSPSSFFLWAFTGILRPAKRQVTRQGSRQVKWDGCGLRLSTINSPPPTAAPTHYRRHQ